MLLRGVFLFFFAASQSSFQTDSGRHKRLHIKSFYCKCVIACRKISLTRFYCLHMFRQALFMPNWIYTRHAGCATPQVIMVHQSGFICTNETGYCLSPSCRGETGCPFFCEAQQQRPWNLQSVQHTITQIALKSLSQRVVIKTNGPHKFASADRVVFNEILWGSQLSVPQTGRGGGRWEQGWGWMISDTSPRVNRDSTHINKCDTSAPGW